MKLPDIYFDYGDLTALKTSSPSLHIWSCSGDDGEGAGEAAAVSGRDVRDRSDEMNAVLRCFDLVADVIGKRIRMCEHLFHEEMEGRRPVSTK